MFVIMAFIELCAWGSFAFPSDPWFLLPFALFTCLAAPGEAHKLFHSARACQLKQVSVYLTHGTARCLAARTAGSSAERSWLEGVLPK